MTTTQTALMVGLALGLPSCLSRAETGSSETEELVKELAGSYRFEGTAVVGHALKGHGQECGPVQPPTFTQFQLDVSQDPGGLARVRIDSAKCSFIARAEEERLVANDEECDLEPSSDLLRVFGVTQRLNRHVELDATSGTFDQFFLDFRVAENDHEDHNCAVLGGFISKDLAESPLLVSDAPVVSYTGTHKRCPEQPVSLAQPTCLAAEWQTAGQLILEARDSGSVGVTEVGLWCTTVADLQSDGTYKAVHCELDSARGLSQMGVVARTFDEFALDLEAQTLNYSATELRRMSDGEFIRRYSASLSW